MTRHHFLSTALAVLLGAGGLSLVWAAEQAQPALASKEIKTAIENADTPQDHRRIAAYYKAEAGRMLAEAKVHDELAVTYANAGDPHKMKHTMSGLTADHCKYFAEAARKAAMESEALAKMHEDMANGAK
jgi:hypothetical protein